MSRAHRRTGMVINYAAVVLVLVFAYVRGIGGWSGIATVLEIVCLVVALVTFLQYHVLTGLWKLVHTKVEKLDERQIQVTHDSLRHSYSIFTVICLLVLLWKSLFQGYDPNLIIVFAALLYLAHTLPSSIVAWTETEV
ncbi:MAG TPA: hypothetical protein VMY05_02590 [Acidobacteriota bacterium]|nr:hypothetical protein [Acidobacteriota bacterium]